MSKFDIKMANSFNRYIFKEVWNQPHYEYRKNIIPALVTNPTSTGRVRLKQTSLSLPTPSDPYLVYAVPNKSLGGVKVKGLTSWETIPDFLEDTRIEFRVHTESGVMLPRGSIYLRSSPETGALLVAVNRNMFTYVLGASHPVKRIFVAVYYDSDIENALLIDSRRIGTTTDVANLLSDCLNADTVFINGRYSNPTTIQDLGPVGTYVELVTDENIVSKFEIDIAMTDDRRNFTSNIDGELKAIIHIPKADNPTNKLLSHNTCDIYVIPRNIQDPHLKGVFLHRAIAEYPIVQLTHNDFAIPEVIINSYTGVLNTDELRFVVYVRDHNKDNVLIPDKNYINLLYTHTDEEILDFFEGTGPAPFEFWKAEHLEMSMYTSMIADVPDTIQKINLYDYIDTLGYFNSLAFVSNRVYRTTVPNDNIRRYLMPIPVVFNTFNLEVAVSINGLKIDDQYVSIIKIKGRWCTLIIDDTIVIEPGDELVAEIYENLPHGIIKVHPTAGFRTVKLLDTSFVLYEVVNNTSPVNGIGTTYDKSYVEQVVSDVADVVMISDGSSSIMFNSTTYGKEYIIAYNEGFSKYTLDIDDILTSNDPVVFDLTSTITELKEDPAFVLDTHTSEVSTTGTFIADNDPDVESTHPAWHLFNGDTTYDQAHSWKLALIPGGVTATYELDSIYHDSVYMIGFKIGTLTDPYDAVRASKMPINYDIMIDGNVVMQVRNEQWYQVDKPIHTHLFQQPVLVSGSIGIRMLGLQVGTVISIQTDMWEPIFTAPTTTVDTPIVGDITAVAYLNGKELVPEIDFRIAGIQNPAIVNSHDPKPHFSGRQFVMNNAAYLVEPTGNRLEVFITHHTMIGSNVGYLTNQIIGDPSTNPMWFTELSNVSVDGHVTKNIAETYGVVKVDDSFRLGAPYVTRTFVPPRGKLFIDRWHPDDDTPVLDQLVPYFRSKAPDPPDLILLPHSHRIVSLFLCIVVRDILNGTLQVSIDPDDSKTLEQLSDYEYLKQYDIALDLSSSVDLNFVDVQPAYVEQIAPDPQTHTIIEHIVNLILRDNVLHGRPNHE